MGSRKSTTRERTDAILASISGDGNCTAIKHDADVRQVESNDGSKTTIVGRRLRAVSGRCAAMLTARSIRSAKCAAATRFIRLTIHAASCHLRLTVTFDWTANLSLLIIANCYDRIAVSWAFCLSTLSLITMSYVDVNERTAC